MRLLPIVERELRLRARWPSTARSRTAVGGVAVLVVSYALLASAGLWSQGRAGREVFQVLSWLALVFVLLEGLRLTHGALSQERNEGTLGLLLLTSLRGLDVVLGKLAASGLTAIYGVLATVPALAITLIVGGVTLGEVGRATLVLLNTLFAALNLGLWVSSREEDSGRALTRSLGWLIAWLGLPWLLETLLHGGLVPLNEITVALLSPAAGLLWSDSALYQAAGGPWKYGAGLLVVHTFAWCLLFVAARRTAAYRHLGTVRGGQRTRQLKRRSAIRSFQGQEHPGRWIATRDTRLRWRAWLAAGFTLAPMLASVALAQLLTPSNRSAAVFTVSYLLLYLAAAVMLASVTCHPLTEARESGTLEMLLTTPTPAGALVRHYWLGICGVLFPPLLTIQILATFVQFLLLGADNRASSFRLDLWAPLIGLAHTVVYLLALTWTGMWFSVGLRKPRQAVLRTVLWAAVLPYAAAYLLLPAIWLVPMFKFPPSLIAPLFSSGPIVVLIFLWRWNRKRVQTRFRQVITQDPFACRETPPPSPSLRRWIRQARRWQAD